MNKKVFIWELIGILFISVLGSLLHFTFEWSGNWKPFALFSAVNESVWKHLKIGFWPALLYSIIQYKYIKPISNNFATAKAVALLIIPTFITVMFYLYTLILGHNVLFIDISIFVISIILAQLASYKLLTYNKLSDKINSISIAVIIILVIAFSTFTFYPPKLSIFMDPRKLTYGI